MCSDGIRNIWTGDSYTLNIRATAHTKRIYPSAGYLVETYNRFAFNA